MNTKICKGCFEELPFTSFYKKKDGKFGLHSKCKACVKKYEIENKERIDAYQRKYRKQHKEETKEYNKRYQEEHKKEIALQKHEYYTKNKEHFRKTNKKYFELNKQKINKVKRQYYLKNRDIFLKRSKENGKAWRIKNREKANSLTNKRRALKKQLPSTLTTKQWNDIKKHFDYCCAYCGRKEKLEQEHFIPISKGGEFTHNNIIPACRSCNSSKQNKDFFEWYSEHEWYSIQRKQNILGFLNYNQNKEQQLALL